MDIQDIKKEFEKLIQNMKDERIDVVAETLTPEEAIGRPSRDDYALVRGKERIVEARFKGYIGHAFTVCPSNFNGTLQDVLDLDLDDSEKCAVFFATINAVMSYLGLVKDTRHCKDDVPMECGKKLAEHLKKYDGKKIGLIGYQPGMAKALAPGLIITDKNPLNIGKEKFGVIVRDAAENEEVIKECDVVCVTGSTVTNSTIYDILEFCKKYDTHPIFFGVTVKGPGTLAGLDMFCPMAQSSKIDE